MNREIKFRGRKPNGKWLYGYLLGNEKGHLAIVQPFKINSYNERSKCEVEIDTIGQFTGSTDKNGKEIYEGDILKADYYDTLHEVVFSDTVGAFMLDEIPSTGDIVVIGYEDIASHFEVIGNIHDNK